MNGWLGHKALVAYPRILMFLTLIADVIVFNNLVLLLFVYLTEKVILLLDEGLLPRSFVGILLGLHQRSLVSTGRIDL